MTMLLMAVDDPARDAVLRMLASYAGLAVGVSLLVSGLKSLWKSWVDGKEPVLTVILTFVLGAGAKFALPDTYGPHTIQSWSLHLIVLLFAAVLAGSFHDKLLNVFTGKINGSK